MKSEIIIENSYDPDITRVLELTGRNLRWFDEHAVEREIFSRYRGRFIAVSKGELFIGIAGQRSSNSRAQSIRRYSHIRYIPQEKAPRIYAY